MKKLQSASAPNHPNIVTIYSMEEAEGFAFIGYVEWETPHFWGEIEHKTENQVHSIMKETVTKCNHCGAEIIGP